MRWFRGSRAATSLRRLGKGGTSEIHPGHAHLAARARPRRRRRDRGGRRRRADAEPGVAAPVGRVDPRKVTALDENFFLVDGWVLTADDVKALRLPDDAL